MERDANEASNSEAHGARTPVRVRFALANGEPIATDTGELLRSELVNVIDVKTGVERSLRLWRKTGTQADKDLLALWRHEIRHVQRVMSYADARDVIVEALEFFEDDEYFGIVLARVGEPLARLLKNATPRYWMRRLEEPGARTLFWRNARRLVVALGILHSQGIVHGNVGPDVVMTGGLEEPDFRLTGFEWSLWLGNAAGRSADAPETSPLVYSFAADWRALGHFIAWSLGGILSSAGDVVGAHDGLEAPSLTRGEALLIRRLVAPALTELVDSPTIKHAIDDILATAARSSTTGGAPLLMLTFANWDRVGEAVYEATGGDIATDEVPAQIDWIQGDLDTGATLLVPRDFQPRTSRLRVVTENMHYELGAFVDNRTAEATWEVAVCQNVRTRARASSVPNVDQHDLKQPVTVVRRFQEAAEMRARRAADVLDWSAFSFRLEQPAQSKSTDVRRALLLAQTLEALVRTLECYPVEVLRKTRDGQIVIRAQDESERDAFARKIGLSGTSETLRRLFDEEQRDPTVAWRLSRSASLGAATPRDAPVHFVTARPDGKFEFNADRDLALGGGYFLRADAELGTEQVIRRRLRNIAAIESQMDLGRALHDPWLARRPSPERIHLDDAEHAELDGPKRRAMEAIFNTLPTFLVVGPPGVGKTKLATEVVRRHLTTEPSARILVSAQGHDALSHLQSELKVMLDRANLDDVIMVRSRPSETRPSTEDDVNNVACLMLDSLASSDLVARAPAELKARVESQRDRAKGSAGTAPQPAAEAEDYAFASLVGDAANIFLSTTNSRDVARLVEAREQFDWVLIEEAAKATGPELVGPLLLSGRRLLIGDHHQLAPTEAERVTAILSEPGLVQGALAIAKRHVAPVFGDAPELDDLIAHLAEPEPLRETSARALRLLEPFRSFVDEDEARVKSNRASRRVSETLTEQRRMDPAIARVVSAAFYKGLLTTEEGRAARALAEPLPYDLRDGMVSSPIVIIDHPHVSTTGRSEPAERERPRWHNLTEVESVVAVLRRVRPLSSGPRPSLAVLSPYAAQVEKLRIRMRQLARGDLAHLSRFAAARSGDEFVGTVDSFQGSEADLVILSLVRNNARAGLGALGFLRDRRRMNVALSRAKRQLVIVGSLSFLDVAVRGTNPRGGPHALSFISDVLDELRAMAREHRRDGVPLVTILDSSKFERKR